MSAQTTQHHDNLARMAALEQRVVGIESGVQGLATAVQALGQKLDQRSSTNWSVIWGAMGVGVTVLGCFGGALIRPIEAEQVRLDRDLRALGTAMVTRAEHEGRWRHQERDVDVFRERIGRVETRAERRLWRLEERALAAPRRD